MRSARTLLLAVVLSAGVIALAPSRPMAAAPNTNGISGAMPAYYDHTLFNINFMQLTTAEATLQAKNSQLNVIWQSDPGLPGGQPFISVIDAIPGDGMNPLWEECQITFNAGHTPRQFFSDDEVHAAEASGEITVTDTHELYRCSVIGKTIVTGRATSRVGGASASAVGGAAAAAGSGAVAPPSGIVATWGAIKRAYR